MMQQFTPMEYLKIDIASNYGLDKSTWDDRIDWFNTHKDEMEHLVKEAEEPALFYAGYQAYLAAKDGKSISYPISLDATASGAQLLSILIGCNKSARLCNVVDTGDREDLYTNVYQAMCTRAETTTKIDRSDTKQAVMTSLYGSQAVPKEVFGEGEMYQVFLDTMNEDAPGIWSLNEALLNLWNPEAYSYDWVMPDGFNVHIKVMGHEFEPIHFLERPYTVTTKVNKPVETGRSIGANLVHSIDGMVVREILRRCTYDVEQVMNARVICLDAMLSSHEGFNGDIKSKNVIMVKQLMSHYKDSGFLSARIIDHIDIHSIQYADLDALDALLSSLPKKPFPVLTIHDCFRVHPNYGNDLRRQYNQILYELAKSHLLTSLASQVVGNSITVTKYDLAASDVLQSNYALS